MLGLSVETLVNGEPSAFHVSILALLIELGSLGSSFGQPSALMPP
ncbi:MAG: hypothetical protein BWY64_02679 [bacterium ADurb.Bin363]|nr:MAG: hypothetical protein BWY64_02679 [bacterium ADurb.Bin363]